MELRVESLVKKFGKQTAVNDISFSLKKGEITGFIGPNGSGKSTTMKMLTGIFAPTSGKILIDDKEIIHNNTTKQLFGYLPEHNPLYLDMYVKEYLGYVANSYKLNNRKEKVEQVIELTGLEVEKNKLIRFLSKGYRQRVGLAQALIHEPPVLILDEPTTGLDPNQIIEIRTLIAEIAKQKTVLLSTHILPEVEAICNHILFINKGKIVADDKTSNVKESHKPNIQTVTVEFKQILEEDWIKSVKEISNYNRVNEYIWQLESDRNVDLRDILFEYAKKIISVF